MTVPINDLTLGADLVVRKGQSSTRVKNGYLDLSNSFVAAVESETVINYNLKIRPAVVVQFFQHSSWQQAPPTTKGRSWPTIEGRFGKKKRSRGLPVDTPRMAKNRLEDPVPTLIDCWLEKKEEKRYTQTEDNWMV